MTGEVIPAVNKAPVNGAPVDLLSYEDDTPMKIYINPSNCNDIGANPPQIEGLDGRYMFHSKELLCIPDDSLKGQAGLAAPIWTLMQTPGESAKPSLFRQGNYGNKGNFVDENNVAYGVRMLPTILTCPTPTYGTHAAGLPIHITGSGFSNKVTDMEITINGIQCVRNPLPIMNSYNIHCNLAAPLPVTSLNDQAGSPGLDYCRYSGLGRHMDKL